jgi:hypothetical protein
LAFLLLTIGMGFNLVGEVPNRGGCDEEAPAMVVELGWRLGFSFKAKLTWGCMGEMHPSLYRDVGGFLMD